MQLVVVSGFRSYVLSPRGLEEGGRQLFRTVIPCYEDTVLTAQCELLPSQATILSHCIIR